MFRRGTRTGLRTAGALAALAVLLVLPTAAAPVQVALERGGDGSYLVHGEFVVEASTAAVWSALTDYERIPTFVRSMRSSRIVESRGDGTTIVEQRAASGFLFVAKTVAVRLQIVREGDYLRFDDLAHSDFKFYSGDWSAAAESTGTRVRYRLLVRPDFAAPSALVGRAMKGGARDLLAEVRDEIARRAASGGERWTPPAAKR